MGCSIEMDDWRYDTLRDCIAVLASSADEQDMYLRRSGFPPEYGNDELALELEDIFLAAGDMISCGELTEVQREAVKPLDRKLAELSGQYHSEFWQRVALWDDERWQAVRALAAEALTEFPEKAPK